jgi:Spy/CpxP family protein refolding chaperone
MNRIILFLFLATSVSLAQPRMMDRHQPQGRGEGQERLMRKLDLKEDQRTKVKAFRSQLRKDQIALRAKIQTLRVELRDLFDAGKPDKVATEAKVGEITKLQGDLKEKMVGFWFDVNSILTPEQQKIWKHVPQEFMRERAGRRMNGWRHRPGMRSHRNFYGDSGGDDSPQETE